MTLTTTTTNWDAEHGPLYLREAVSSTAAFIDGANYPRTYWNIIPPLSRLALVAVALSTFLSVWNDFLTPLIYLSNPGSRSGRGP